MKRAFKILTMFIHNFLLYLIIISTLPSTGDAGSYENEHKLTLPSFYKSDPYTHLKEYKIKKKDENTCNPFIESFFGYITKEKYVYSPTKAATDGLVAILNNQTKLAIDCGETLQKNQIRLGNAILFPFKTRFLPYLPYDMKPPWTSAITQGLSLGLFSHLYLKTGDNKFKKIADSIFESYKVPIEKGGFTRYYPNESVLFEEYPASEEIAVFNGSVVAALALYDYYIITQNKEAIKLFNKFVKWLEDNIHRFETREKEYNITLTYYSLAKKRPGILFRFTDGGEYIIKEILFYGISNGTKRLLGSLSMGSKEDNLPSEQIYIWAAREYTNWGKRKSRGRTINSHKGIYNHSPFYAAVDLKYQQYEIDVNYISLSNKTTDLQAYDGREYHYIGKLRGGIKRHYSSSYRLDPFFLECFKKNLNTGPFIEEKYLDDNYLLLKLFSKVSDSKILKEHLREWEDSKNWVSAEQYNKFPLNIFFEEKTLINKTEKCAMGVSNPKLIYYDNNIYLFYNCIVNRSEQRIAVAGGKNLSDLNDYGWISGKLFEEKFNTLNFLLPNILFPKDKPILIFISPDINKMGVAQSNNLWEWDNYTSIEIQYPIERFDVDYKDDKVSILFIKSNEKNIIYKSYIEDFKSIPEGQKLLEEKNFFKIQSFTTTQVEEYQILLVKADLPRRSEIDLYVNCGGLEFKKSHYNPIYIDQDFLEAGTSIKNDIKIFEMGDKMYLLYTGYSKHNRNSTGLYIARIAKDLLKGYTQETCKDFMENK